MSRIANASLFSPPFRSLTIANVSNRRGQVAFKIGPHPNTEFFPRIVISSLIPTTLNSRYALVHCGPVVVEPSVRRQESSISPVSRPGPTPAFFLNKIISQSIPSNDARTTTVAVMINGQGDEDPEDIFAGINSWRRYPSITRLISLKNIFHNSTINISIAATSHSPPKLNFSRSGTAFQKRLSFALVDGQDEDKPCSAGLFTSRLGYTPFQIIFGLDNGTVIDKALFG
ncbi:hypothetical protein C8J56DRAFT_1039177 [Mycena floridula]|nr:hypothetical protein C8J56DRAFT_1039177 [Mycena floridula]